MMAFPYSFKVGGAVATFAGACSRSGGGVAGLSVIPDGNHGDNNKTQHPATVPALTPVQSAWVEALK